MSVTILDGGLGQELVHRSGDDATPLWSTQVMVDHPGLVQQVHEDYFKAGADVATTNTYALHKDRLEKFGREDELENLISLALKEAAAARDANGGGLIAGAIGPLGASYRPDLAPAPEKAAPLYAQVAALVAPGADMLILETVSSIAQAEGALMGTGGFGKPVWIAFSVSDTDGSILRSGEPLADVAPLIRDYAPDAVLANCSVPEVMEDALKVIGQFGLPFGAYANGFTHITADFLADNPTVDALRQRSDLGPERYAEHVMRWIDLGATIVGGCCEVGPNHIAEISRQVKGRQNA